MRTTKRIDSKGENARVLLARPLILVGSLLATPACGLIASIPSYDAVGPDAAADRDSGVVGLADGAPGALESDSAPASVDVAAPDAGTQDSGAQSTADAAPDAAPDAGSDAAPEAAGDAMTDATADASDASIACGSNLLVISAVTASPTPISPPALAVDGDLTTRWESEWGVDPQWIYADFGAPAFIDRVRINWQAACAANYLIQVSDDTATWTTIGTVTANAAGSGNAPTDWSTAVDTTGIAGVGRYMRVYGMTRCQTGYGYSIWELQAFGDTNSSCSP